MAGTPLPPANGIITQPPDIAIEIVSPTPRDCRRDRVEKLVDYSAFRVRYYWIGDPQFRSLEILRLGAQGRYEHLLGATEAQVDIPGCEGFVVDLDEVWGGGRALRDPRGEGGVRTLRLRRRLPRCRRRDCGPKTHYGLPRGFPLGGTSQSAAAICGQGE